MEGSFTYDPFIFLHPHVKDSPQRCVSLPMEDNEFKGRDEDGARGIATDGEEADMEGGAVGGVSDLVVVNGVLDNGATEMRLCGCVTVVDEWRTMIHDIGQELCMQQLLVVGVKQDDCGWELCVQRLHMVGVK
ncbi:putative sestrin-like protein [Sesbania bispinosa]|nr:putative sestrin-like protein [Sesbania bispinosa]